MICDLILTFVLLTNGVPETRTVWTNTTYAEKFLDEERYGKLTDVEAVEQFECSKGPRDYSKRHGL
jgi:hypothetical protein